MITWMQRHKKYLIVTIWISTIAFIGAGFVGWGQYSYGDKAGVIAKVGTIEISQGELQKAYSNLYTKYNNMFQGNFDEEKAKQFGLQKQALNQLTQEALILNLASSYDLQISDEEILAKLKTQEYFFNNGAFNKEIYKQVLSRNNLAMKEYEDELRKTLLIQKTLKLLPIEASKSESNIINTIANIADKISYKVLSKDDITVDTSDSLVKKFWESKKFDFMSEVSYDINFIKQNKVTKNYEESRISAYYNDNKNHFKDSDGKIIPLVDAKDAVITELDADSTKNVALRTYIAYKKNKLDKNIKINAETISISDNPFDGKTFQKISKLSLTAPFMKPILINKEYYTIKLLKVNESKIKTYKDAKKEVLPLYIEETKNQKLMTLANNSITTFQGENSDFITSSDIDKLNGISTGEAKDFLQQLFLSQKKNSYIKLNSGKIILYNILEQKMLNKQDSDQSKNIISLKSNIFNEGLIKELQKMYQTEIFVKGL